MRLTFVGGDSFSGASASDIILQLSKYQFDPAARANVKRALAWNAWVLTRTPVDEDLPDLDFLIDYCEKTNLAHLEIETEKGVITYGTTGPQPPMGPARP